MNKRTSKLSVSMVWACAATIAASTQACHNSSVVGSGDQGASGGQAASGGSAGSSAGGGNAGSSASGGNAGSSASGGNAGGGSGGQGGNCPGATNPIFSGEFTSSCASAVWSDQLGTPENDGAIAAFGEGAAAFVATITNGNLDAPNLGGRDVSLKKYTADGQLLWSTQYGTPENDTAESIQGGRDGRLWIAGYTSGTLAEGDAFAHYAGSELYLRAFDGAGSVLWTRQIGAGTYIDGSVVGRLTDTDVTLFGRVQGEWMGQPDPGYKASFAARFDSAGELVWSALLASDARGEFNDATLDSDGNLLAVRRIKLQDGSFQPTLLTLDPQGNELAREELPALGRLPTSIEVGTQGERYIGTSEGAQYYLNKFASDGSFLWNFSLGQEGGVIKPLPDEGALVVTGSGLGLLVLDRDGEVVTVSQFGTSGTQLYSLDVWPQDGSLLFAGQTTDALTGYTPAGGTDAFVFRVKSSSLLPQ